MALASRFLAQPVPPAAVALTLFIILCLSFFVLSGMFNIVINTASHVLKKERPLKTSKGTPRVAIFYCTYNDFDREGADTLLDLSYRNVDLWFLDDSTDSSYRDEVDRFAASARARGRRVLVLRRKDRRGYKAGAINLALSQLPPDVEFVGLVDADERLAPDFVEGCLSHFTGPDIAFVQANHVCINKEESWFTRHLGVGVDLHWRHYQPYRNRFGTVNLLGHGALIRRDMLDRLGGFPELTCEDLAFTVEARMAGYRGRFAADVVCGEKFPRDFAAMRRRHLRWSWATVEFLRRYFWKLLRSKVPLHEKLDLLLPSVNLPAVLLLVSFLVTVQGMKWVGPGFGVFTDPVVIGLGALASLAPLMMFIDLFPRPVFALKTILANTVAYIALFPVSVVGVLKGFLKPAEFLVTPKAGTGSGSFLKAMKDARIEVAFGIVLLLFGFLTLGPIGLASPLAVCAIGSPILLATSQKALTPASMEKSNPSPYGELDGAM